MMLFSRRVWLLARRRKSAWASSNLGPSLSSRSDSTDEPRPRHIADPQGWSASKFRRPCSPAPTRWSNEQGAVGQSWRGSVRSVPMGHRLITALIALNVIGFLACVALIIAATSKDDAVVLAQVTHAVFVSVRMFVVGAAVPTVAWGIAALEFDRSHTTKRSLASATMYALLVVSLILFCIAGWRLPRAFLDSLQITVEFSDAL